MGLGAAISAGPGKLIVDGRYNLGLSNISDVKGENIKTVDLYSLWDMPSQSVSNWNSIDRDPGRLVLPGISYINTNIFDMNRIIVATDYSAAGQNAMLYAA